ARGALGEVADRAQQVGDGASAGGQDGGEEQQGEALVSGLGEGGGEFLEQGHGLRRYTGHGSLLARSSRVVGQPPRIPSRRLVHLPHAGPCDPRKKCISRAQTPRSYRPSSSLLRLQGGR